MKKSVPLHSNRRHSVRKQKCFSKVVCLAVRENSEAFFVECGHTARSAETNERWRYSNHVSSDHHIKQSDGKKIVLAD